MKNCEYCCDHIWNKEINLYRESNRHLFVWKTTGRNAGQLEEQIRSCHQLISRRCGYHLLANETANHVRDSAVPFLHHGVKKCSETSYTKLITMLARLLSHLDNYEYNAIRVLIRGARDPIGSPFNGCINY